MTNGLMVLADDYNNEVKVVQPNGVLKKSIKTGGAYDVTLINEKLVALCNPQSRSIYIIDVQSSAVCYTLKTNIEVLGITHYQGQIICCLPRKGLMRIDAKTGKIDDHVYDDESVGEHSHVITDGDRICYTSFSAITVLDSNFKVILRYTDQNYLSDPVGIAIDKHQNMFVSSNGNDKLLLISKNGSNYEVLLDKTDDPRGP